MCAGAFKGQKKIVDLLKLEGVMRHLACVLGRRRNQVLCKISKLFFFSC